MTALITWLMASLYHVVDIVTPKRVAVTAGRRAKAVTFIEYALLAAIAVALAVLAWQFLIPAISGVFGGTSNCLSGSNAKC